MDFWYVCLFYHLGQYLYIVRDRQKRKARTHNCIFLVCNWKILIQISIHSTCTQLHCYSEESQWLQWHSCKLWKLTLDFPKKVLHMTERNIHFSLLKKSFLHELDLNKWNKHLTICKFKWLTLMSTHELCWVHSKSNWNCHIYSIHLRSDGVNARHWL